MRALDLMTSRDTIAAIATAPGRAGIGVVRVSGDRCEVIELSGAQRFGERGRSWIAGLTLTRDVIRFPGPTEVVYGFDFDEPQPYPGDLPPALQGQLVESGCSRFLNEPARMRIYRSARCRHRVLQ